MSETTRKFTITYEYDVGLSNPYVARCGYEWTCDTSFERARSRLLDKLRRMMQGNPPPAVPPDEEVVLEAAKGGGA